MEWRLISVLRDLASKLRQNYWHPSKEQQKSGIKKRENKPETIIHISDR